MRSARAWWRQARTPSLLRRWRPHAQVREADAIDATTTVAVIVDFACHHRTTKSDRGGRSRPFVGSAPARAFLGMVFDHEDFSGTITFEFSGGFLERFQVKDVKNEFTATTQDFRQRFPNLRGIVPVDSIRPADD